jgi:ubiquinone/menaquinone biosynthesis C-methylase UbiE
VTGLDIDPIVQSNVHCQQAVVYDGVHIPLEDNSFDLAVSSFVSEHIENPIEVTREINRVLCPGGLYIFRTPNLWHYVSLIAKVTPQWFHTAIADRVRNRQGKHEPWPTYHRMNTRRACRNILKAAGFEIKVLKIIEPEPSYAMWSRAAFYPCDDVGEALELIASL